MVKHAPPAQMVALQSSIESITQGLNHLDTSLHSEMTQPEDADRQLTSLKAKVDEHTSLLGAQASHLAEINTRITSLEEKAGGHGGVIARYIHTAEALDKRNESTSNDMRNLASPPLTEHTLTDNDWLDELLASKIKDFPGDQPFIDQCCRPRFEQWSPHQLQNLRRGIHDGLGGGDREMLNKLFAQRVPADWRRYVASPMTESQKLEMAHAHVVSPFTTASTQRVVSHAHDVGPMMIETPQRAMAGAHVFDPLITESVLGGLYQPHIDDSNVTDTNQDVLFSHVNHPEALDEGNELTSKDASSPASPPPIQYTFYACPEDYAGRPLPDWLEEHFAARISCDPMEQSFIDDFLRPQCERWLPRPDHFEELRPGIQNGIFLGFKSTLGGDRGHFINSCKCFEDKDDNDTVHNALSAVKKLSTRLTQLEDIAKLNHDNKDGRVDLACALVEKVSNRLTKLEKSRAAKHERANHHHESVVARIDSIETDTKEKFSKSNLFLTELEKYVDDFQSDVVDKTELQDEQISILELKVGDLECCLAKLSEKSAAASAAEEGKATKIHESCNARHQEALACQISCRVRIAKLEAELEALKVSSYLGAPEDTVVKDSPRDFNMTHMRSPEVAGPALNTVQAFPDSSYKVRLKQLSLYTNDNLQMVDDSATSISSHAGWQSAKQKVPWSGDLDAFADSTKGTRPAGCQRDYSTKRFSWFDPHLTYPEQLAMGQRTSLFGSPPAFQAQLATDKQDGLAKRFSSFDPAPSSLPKAVHGDHTAKTEHRPAPSCHYDSAAQGSLFPLYRHEQMPLTSSTHRHEQPIGSYSVDPSQAAEMRALYYELNPQTATQEGLERHASVEDWPEVDDDGRASLRGYSGQEAPGKWSLARSRDVNTR